MVSFSMVKGRPNYIPYKQSPAFEEILQVINLYGIICGGFIRRYLVENGKFRHGGDCDIYCLFKEAYLTLLERIKKFTGEKIISESPYAITIGGGDWGRRVFEPSNMIPVHPISIQLIKPLDFPYLKTFGTPEEIMSYYDFTIVRGAALSSTDFLIDENFFEHNSQKQLVIKHISNPYGTFCRIIKYAKMGFKIEGMEVLKVLNQWLELAPEARETMKQFLEYNSIFDIEKVGHLYGMPI